MGSHIVVVARVSGLGKEGVGGTADHGTTCPLPTEAVCIRGSKNTSCEGSTAEPVHLPLHPSMLIRLLYGPLLLDPFLLALICSPVSSRSLSMISHVPKRRIRLNSSALCKRTQKSF